MVKTASIRLFFLRLVRRAGGLPLRRRGLVYLITALVIFIVMRNLLVQESHHALDDDAEEVMLGGEKEGGIVSSLKATTDKWIVVTTIHRPTETLKQLSQQLLSTGWRMVVIGDRKTPTDWRLPNVKYLDIYSQKRLGYKVYSYLPYDTYSRKSIGYLYAIQHGARYIYEVDDDNFPYDELKTFRLSSEPSSHLVIDTSELTYNPYVHFGQSSLWPRGYPLDRIGADTTHKYRLCTTHVPAVQQGVVNGDPDVDALFRLTRRRSSTALNLTFDKVAPLFTLPAGTFAPFNSQNTLYLHKAFWILTLPAAVTDRTADIYRSYWAQRLLWLVGENIAFTPPNAAQQRSGHSDITDATDEAEMYINTGRYLKVLSDWQCTDKFLFDCARSLSYHLVKEGLWKPSDAQLVDAWISDLSMVGYAPPALVDKPSDICLQAKDPVLPVVFYPVEQKTSMSNTKHLQLVPQTNNQKEIETELKAWCSDTTVKSWQRAVETSGHKYKDTLLVISIYTEARRIIPKLEAFYKPHFPHILYCTNQEIDESFVTDWKVSVVKLSRDVGVITCMTAAAKMRYNAKGYLHISETMWLNGQESLSKKILTLSWMTGEFAAFKDETLRQCASQSINCRTMSRDLLITMSNQISGMDSISSSRKTTLRNCLTKIGKEASWMTQTETVWITDIALYLPARLLDNMQELQQIVLADAETAKYEFLTVLLVECEQFAIEYLKTTDKVDTDINTDYVYPFFFKSISKDESSRKQFCKHFEQYN